MNEFCFEYEQTPWEAVLDTLHPGDSVSAVRLLALLEGEDESAVEDAFRMLEQKHIRLDIDMLPRDYGSGETEKRLRREEMLVQSGKLMENLSETDPLRLYLQELAETPAVGDEQLLAQRYLDGEAEVEQQLINVTISRAVEASTEMTGRGVLLLDLIQEASLGLWQGVLQYRGGAFDSHIQWWIRQYLAYAVLIQARNNGVGQKLRKALEDYREADRKLLIQLGRNPTLEEIAQELRISLEEAEVYSQMLLNARTVEKAKAQPEEDPEEENRAVEDTAYFQSRQRVLEMLSTLSELEAQVLTMRFGLEGGMPLSPQEIGQKLNLTADDVVNMEANALQKLRKEDKE